jgi:hypothetical protein
MNRPALVGLGVLVIVIGVNTASGQQPMDITCATFVVDTSTVYATPAKMKMNLDAVATTHAAEVERWLEERAAAGQQIMAYRTSVGALARGVVDEVVCVR